MDLLKEQFLNFQLKTALSLNEGFRDVDVGKVGSEHIYTNSEVKQSFIESIKSQSTFKPVMVKIIELVETDRIIPAFVKIGILQRIIRFYKKEKEQFAESKHAMARYDIDSGKVIVLVENINNSEYWKKQEALSLILLHEFQHMTSVMFPNSFITIHLKAMVLYYRMFFKIFFNVVIHDNELVKFVKWLHSKTESVSGRMNETGSFSHEYMRVLWDIVSPHYSDRLELQKKLVNYFKAISIYMAEPELYQELIYKIESDVHIMYTALKDSYKSLNILKTDTLAIQEIMYPSEIICIESEYNTQPRHFKLITQIE